MRKDRQIPLLERLLAVVEQAHPASTATESRIDVERYVSAERLAAERAVLFRARPIVVGRAEDVATPGAFFTHDAAGLPLLVTRDASGTVRAMLNVCRHRGTRLVDTPCGSAKAFVCRYHAWTYDLRGALGHVPMAECFSSLDKASRGLALLPCEVRHGFVWVTLTPEAPIDVGAFLGSFDEDFSGFGLEDHVVFARSRSVRAANWKLVMDAFLEGYHVKSLHQRTLARFFADDVVVDTDGENVRSVGARKNIAELRTTAPETWDVRASTTVFYNLMPNGVLVFHPETVSHIALFPRGVGEVEFVHTMLAPHPPKDEAQRVAWQRTWELIDGKVFAEEDLAIAESIQSTLASGANTSFPLGSLEHPIRFFHDGMDRILNAARAR